jgi:hypothetical protein
VSGRFVVGRRRGRLSRSFGRWLTLAWPYTASASRHGVLKRRRVPWHPPTQWRGPTERGATIRSQVARIGGVQTAYGMRFDGEPVCSLARRLSSGLTSIPGRRWTCCDAAETSSPSGTIYGVSAPAVLVPPPGRHEKKRGLPMHAHSSEQFGSEQRHKSVPVGSLNPSTQVSPSSRSRGERGRPCDKSLASGGPRSAYPVEAEPAEQASERPYGTAQRRTANASRSRACGSLLASYAEARVCLRRACGLSASGRAQRPSPAARGRGLLSRRARYGGAEQARTSCVGLVGGALSPVRPRSAEPRSDQGRASMMACAGSVRR